ncbi:MAG: DUF167 domain-containing protein [Patescibacteria group bacterium]
MYQYQKSDELVLNIKVIPNASKSEIVGEQGDFLKVKIKEKAEKGKANSALIDLLSDNFKISKNNIEILRGSRSSKKVVKLKGYNKKGNK